MPRQPGVEGPFGHHRLRRSRIPSPESYPDLPSLNLIDYGPPSVTRHSPPPYRPSPPARRGLPRAAPPHADEFVAAACPSAEGAGGCPATDSPSVEESRPRRARVVLLISACVCVSSGAPVRGHARTCADGGAKVGPGSTPHRPGSASDRIGPRSNPDRPWIGPGLSLSAARWLARRFPPESAPPDHPMRHKEVRRSRAEKRLVSKRGPGCSILQPLRKIWAAATDQDAAVSVCDALAFWGGQTGPVTNAPRWGQSTMQRTLRMSLLQSVRPQLPTRPTSEQAGRVAKRATTSTRMSPWR